MAKLAHTVSTDCPRCGCVLTVKGSVFESKLASCLRVPRKIKDYSQLSQFQTCKAVRDGGRTASAAPSVMMLWSATSQRAEFSEKRETCVHDRSQPNPEGRHPLIPANDPGPCRSPKEMSDIHLAFEVLAST